MLSFEYAKTDLQKQRKGRTMLRKRVDDTTFYRVFRKEEPVRQGDTHHDAYLFDWNARKEERSDTTIVPFEVPYENIKSILEGYGFNDCFIRFKNKEVWRIKDSDQKKTREWVDKDAKKSVNVYSKIQALEERIRTLEEEKENQKSDTY